MRKALTPLVLLLVVFLSACSGPTGDPTWTVTGTISTHSMNLGTEASVSVSAGNKLMDTQVAIPDPADPAGDQVVTYSITDIPPDTYEVAVTLTSNIGWKGVKYSYGFTVITVNGKQQSAASDSVGTVPQTRTFSLNERLPITGATTINFDLHPVVSPGKN